MSKKNKWENNAIWEKFIAPLVAWIKSLNMDEQTDEMLDMVENAEFQIKRGTRNASNRQNIVKSLKLEFGHLEFEGWTSVRIDKDLLKKMKKQAKDNRPVHIDFFNNTSVKPTYVKDDVRYQHTADSYADKQEEADLRNIKLMYRELESLDATFGVESNDAS